MKSIEVLKKNWEKIKQHLDEYWYKYLGAGLEISLRGQWFYFVDNIVSWLQSAGSYNKAKNPSETIINLLTN